MVSPQVFTCYLLLTINFSHLYRDYTMTEFVFFAGKEDRWGNNMMALWGNLNICPHLNYWNSRIIPQGNYFPLVA